MCRNRITCNIFRKSNSLQQFFLFKKQLLNSPVLVTQLNFQVKNLLAITDETKMTGLNNTCMNRADTHFVQFFTFNFKKGIICDCHAFIKPVKWKPDRLQPGMICIMYSEIFMNLSFKFFKYKIVFCKRRQRLSSYPRSMMKY